VDLCEVCTKIVDGSHNPPKASLSGLPMLSARNIESRGISLKADYRLIGLDGFDVEHRRTQIAKGDVLLTIVGAIGRTAVVSEELLLFTLQRSVAVLKPSPGISSRYLAYALESPSSQKYLLDNAKGTAQKGIYLKTLGGLSLHLSPSEEQRRIAAKLDTTLAAVDACRQRLDGVAAILKRFRQAVLTAATSGELTREWREEMDCEHTWLQTTIDQIAKVGTGSTPLRSNPAFYGNAGIPWITSAATSSEIITSASEFVTEQGQAASRLRIYPEGTLLVAMYGEGKTRGQVSELGIPATINQACAAIHDAIELHLMPFVKIALKANYLEMRDLAEGGNQPNLNLSKIKKFPIALPSKDEVFEICGRVEALFTLADQVEARLTAARKVVDRLTPALLAKAFRGELVPQDPNDEAASVLLERIRAARQTEAGAGKPSRRGRPKAAANPDQLPLDAAPVPSEPPPPNLLTQLLQECGALSERALLAASELEPEGFFTQLERELRLGSIRQSREEGQVLLEAVS
jgi:type I restriction enzyme S subunit